MSPVVKAFSDLAARIVFRAAEVSATTDHGSDFRTIELAGDALRGVSWRVGDKLQVRADPNGFALRTYTPVSWDPDEGTARLLVYAHGLGPGSTWATGARVGDGCQVFGPRRSLALDRLDAPLVLVGDETSFALAAAWHQQNPDHPAVAALFEVGDPDAGRRLLDGIGVTGAHLVAREQGSSHLPELARSLIELLGSHPEATVCLTGKAQTIAHLRRQLKDSTVAGRSSLVKAYWDENRSGLD